MAVKTVQLDLKVGYYHRGTPSGLARVERCGPAILRVDTNTVVRAKGALRIAVWYV